MERTYIIAEAGVNHNGSLDMAKRLIDAASDAGADAVKFQTFKAERLLSKRAAKADYQKQTTNADETQYEMIRKLELDEAMHEALIAHAGTRGIAFLSTPFDPESVDLLAGRFDLPLLKIPSGEATNAPLLLKMAQTGKQLVLSTGMCTLSDVEAALAVLAFGLTRPGETPSLPGFSDAYASAEGQQALRERVTLLHCTTEYPAPLQDVSLRTMETMRQAFGLPVGYSDHTAGIAVPLAAVALGAVLIEKHFTLDRSLPGPDHKASLEPQELAEMVKGIRSIESALGTGRKAPSPSERKNMAVARKSIVALRPIQAGEVLTEENIGVKRPGTGISPLFFWEVLGTKANRAFEEDEAIER